MNYFNNVTAGMEIELMIAVTTPPTTDIDDDDDNDGSTNNTTMMDDDTSSTNSTMMDDDTSSNTNSTMAPDTDNNNGTATFNMTALLGRTLLRQLQALNETEASDNTTNTTTPSTSTTTSSIFILIEDMNTTITIVSQNVTNSSSSPSSSITYNNVIQYQQQLQYRYYVVSSGSGSGNITDDGNEMNTTETTVSTLAGNSTDMEDGVVDDMMIAQALALQPFLPVSSLQEYQSLVQMNVVPFANVGDIGPPKFMADDVVPTTTAPVMAPVPAPVAVMVPSTKAPVAAEDKELSSAAIAGIAVGGLVFLGLLLYGFVIFPYDYKRYNSNNAAPVQDNDHLNDMGVDNGDDVAVVAATAPLTDNSNSRSKKLAQETETAAMVNKSIITKQHSYGAEETSTLGGFSANNDDIPDVDGASYEGRSIDTTEFDYAKVAGATAVVGGAAALGSAITSDDNKRGNDTASGFDDSDIHGDDHQFVIYAPAGKLGLVVDNPDDGAPVVHAIKEDSVLIGQVQVGDRLIGVDEVDVRTLSPVKVSKLISKRSSNPLRKLTLVRGKPDYDEYDTGTDGGDTASHTVDTASHVDMPDEEEGEEVADGTVRSSDNIAALPPNPPPMYDPTQQDDDETSHVESMSRLSGEEDNDDEEEEEEESVMDYPDDTSSAVDAMSHTSGYGGIPPAAVDETKTDDGGGSSSQTTTTEAATSTQVGEATSEQSTTTSTTTTGA